MSLGLGADGGDRTPVVEALSQLRLRELLAGVQDRIAQLVDVHDRMDRLIGAMLIITAYSIWTTPCGRSCTPP